MVWSELTTWHNVIYKRPKSSLKVAAALVGVASLHASAGKWLCEMDFQDFYCSLVVNICESNLTFILLEYTYL